MGQKKSFRLNEYVLFLGRRRGKFYIPEILKYFRGMTASEVKAIRKGDIIWTNETLNRNVFGFVKREVSKIEPHGNRHRIYLGDRGCFATFSPNNKNRSNKFFLVEDEAKLAQLVSENPLPTQVSPESQ